MPTPNRITLIKPGMLSTEKQMRYSDKKNFYALHSAAGKA